jgi:hypothetical protein
MKLLTFAVAACAAALLAAPSAPQTISGCGTTAIPKASQNSAPKLSGERDCFRKAESAAKAAADARQARIAAITPTPSPAPTPAPTPVAETWLLCAYEGQRCGVQGTTRVRYGAFEKGWITKTVSGPVDCNTATFGDPAPYRLKQCEYMDAAGVQPSMDHGSHTDKVAPAAIAAADAYTIKPRIPSNFDRTGLIWKPAGAQPPKDAEQDPVGAFRFICGPGQIG